MNKALKTGISVVMCIAFAAVCAYALAFYEPDVSDTDFYAEWMNCISDEARVTEIVLPGTHNSGAVDCCLLANEKVPLNWLNCQQDGIYEQLCYGARYFDLRILYSEANKTVYCAHGLGTGITLEEALSDLQRFDSEYPGQFYFISLCLYDSNNGVPPEGVMDEILSRYIPSDRVFTGDKDVAEMTLGEMRASEKTFVLMTETEWAPVVSAFSEYGTWNSDTNFGTADSGAALYDYLYEALDERGASDDAVFKLDLNRASGSSLNKELPLDFMLGDREKFLKLIDDTVADETRLANANFFMLDFATYDYVQCANVIGLNLGKGVVEPEYAEKLQAAIELKLSENQN